jgi:hypothetical protein
LHVYFLFIYLFLRKLKPRQGSQCPMQRTERRICRMQNTSATINPRRSTWMSQMYI